MRSPPATVPNPLPLCHPSLPQRAGSGSDRRSSPDLPQRAVGYVYKRIDQPVVAAEPLVTTAGAHGATVPFVGPPGTARRTRR
ncbi:hypothetical protein [Streptosporangium minutum]|uniref:hypothetical protein n=1 Tax=Streptosporangium minutum TaxID=569862 RepID=UPI003BF9C05F